MSVLLDCFIITHIVNKPQLSLKTVVGVFEKSSTVLEFHNQSRVNILSPSQLEPRAGSGVVRMDPLRFLAGCRTRRLNQA